jgi:alpha/beta superfamily hydrolase
MGGSRSDPRLQAVSDALECACLRFDHGAWDEGRGELADTRAALAWARQNYRTVALFGYSFGGCLALVATARESKAGTPPKRVVALSPAARISEDIDAVTAIDDIDCPVGIVHGRRDSTVDTEALTERVRERDGTVVVVSAGHHFTGQTAAVGDRVAELLSM